ncbi:hypothetical protein C8T65DRAFT_741337 [Cerioporus squamosus]|nr:hypothetical protein C8T65DRAFT_741337 [Cerioporus squamosus]
MPDPSSNPTIPESQWNKGASDALWRAGEHGTVTVYYPEKPSSPSTIGRTPSRAIRPQVILNYYAQKYSSTGRLRRTKNTPGSDSGRSRRLSGTTKTSTSAYVVVPVVPHGRSSAASAQLTRPAMDHFFESRGSDSIHHLSLSASTNSQCTHHFRCDCNGGQHYIRNCSSVIFHDGVAPPQEEDHSLSGGRYAHAVEEPANTPSTSASEDDGLSLVGSDYEYSGPEQHDDEDSIYGDNCGYSVEEPADTPSTRVSEEDDLSVVEGYYDYPVTEQYQVGDNYGRPALGLAKPPCTRVPEDDGLSLVGDSYDYPVPQQYQDDGSSLVLVEHSYNHPVPEYSHDDGPSLVGDNYGQPVERSARPPCTRLSEDHGPSPVGVSYDYLVPEQYQDDGFSVDEHSYDHAVPVYAHDDGPSLVGDSCIYTVPEQYHVDGSSLDEHMCSGYLVPQQYQHDGLVESNHDCPVTEQYQHGGPNLVEHSYDHPVPEQYQDDGLVGGSYDHPVVEQYQDDNRIPAGGGYHYTVPEQYQDDGRSLVGGCYNSYESSEDDHSLVRDSYVNHKEAPPPSPSTHVFEQFTTPEDHRSQMPYSCSQHDSYNGSYTGQLGTNPSSCQQLMSTVNSAFTAVEIASPVNYPMLGAAHY